MAVSRVKGNERIWLYSMSRKRIRGSVLVSVPVAELHLFADLEGSLGNVEGSNGVVGRMAFVRARSRFNKIQVQKATCVMMRSPETLLILLVCAISDSS